MSSPVTSETRVCLKSSPEYLPRLRKIVACLADSVGMDEQEMDEVKLVLTEACVNAIRHGSPNGDIDNVLVTFQASGHILTADVTDSGSSDSSAEPAAGLGVRIMRKLTDSLEFIRHHAGLTVRLTKRAKSPSLSHKLTSLDWDEASRN